MEKDLLFNRYVEKEEKKCVYSRCKSNSLYPLRYTMQGVKFFSFPHQSTPAGRLRANLWVEACNRENFTIEDINDNSYVCSKHFVESCGPTEMNPDPIPANISSELNAGNVTALRMMEPSSYVRRRWKEQETFILLDTIKELNLDPSALRLTYENRECHRLIKKKLEERTGLRRRTEQIQGRFQYLKYIYLKEKEKDYASNKPWIYFELMDSIFKTKTSDIFKSQPEVNNQPTIYPQLMTEELLTDEPLVQVKMESEIQMEFMHEDTKNEEPANFIYSNINPINEPEIKIELADDVFPNEPENAPEIKIEDFADETITTNYYDNDDTAADDAVHCEYDTSPCISSFGNNTELKITNYNDESVDRDSGNITNNDDFFSDTSSMEVSATEFQVSTSVVNARNVYDSSQKKSSNEKKLKKIERNIISLKRIKNIRRRRLRKTSLNKNLRDKLTALFERQTLLMQKEMRNIKNMIAEQKQWENRIQTQMTEFQSTLLNMVKSLCPVINQNNTTLQQEASNSQ